jgi:hypothetical protein
MWLDCNRDQTLNAQHNSDPKLPPVLSSVGGSGKSGTKDGGTEDGADGFQSVGVATDTASVAITVARLFGLDAGDWSMILLGLALSALLLVFA